MRTFVMFLFVLPVGILACAQQRVDYPKDGNGLLDYCGTLVTLADSESSIAALSNDRFTQKMGQLNWCVGYLSAIQDAHVQTVVNLGLMGMTGVTLAGPDKAKKWAFETLQGPCIPDKAPILELARVLVKWLREHPERLHESKGILTVDAFKDSFRCEDSPKEAKPAQPQSK